MATCVASTRSSSRKTLKKCKQLFHLQIDAHCRASIKHDFTDDTEIEQAVGELTPKKAKNDSIVEWRVGWGHYDLKTSKMTELYQHLHDCQVTRLKYQNTDKNILHMFTKLKKKD